MNSDMGLLARDGAPIPLLGVRVDGDILGRGARVRVLHKFKNTETKPIEAVYRFPLPATAAICGFRAHIGDRTIDGSVEEREEAFKAYDEVLMKGYGGYLLDQERPNIFTLSVGNLNSGAEAIVEVEYVTLLDVEESRVRFCLPTSISPRYVPPDMPDDNGIPTGDLIHPLYAPNVPYGLSLSLRVHDAARLSSVESPSHPVRCDMTDDLATVELSADTVRMDRDFVLYIGHESMASISRAYRYTSKDSVFLQVDLLLESIDEEKAHARSDTNAVARPTREVIFVLDCSGSMMGDSITQAKKALEICLKGLRPGTRFNVYRFGSTFDSLFEKAAVYDGDTLRIALDYLADADANLGGTEILGPIRHIYRNAPSGRSQGRDIVFMTDGEVANEGEVIRLVKANCDTTRVFSLGIGSGPNDYLIRELAKAAKGVPGFIFPGQRIEPAVLSMFSDIMATCIDDLKFEWKSRNVDQAPDSFVVSLGRPTTVFCRIRGRARKTETLAVKGCVNGRQVHWDLKIQDPPSDQLPIPTLWARERIRDLEEAQAAALHLGSRQRERKSQQAAAAIVGISKQYGLLSSLTSYVAVEKRKGEARTTGEVVLRRVPALITTGWHGIWGLPAFELIGADLGLSGPSAMPGPQLDHGIKFSVADYTARFQMPARRSRSRLKPPLDEERLEASLLKILALQLAEGGFEIDRGVGSMLGIRVRDLRKMAKEMEVNVEVDRFRLLCTALIVHVLGAHFAGLRDQWEGAAEKSVRWLDDKVKRGNPTIKREPLMEFAADFARKKVKI